MYSIFEAIADAIRKEPFIIVYLGLPVAMFGFIITIICLCR